MVGICLHPTCSACSRRFPVCPEPRASIALTKVSAFSILLQVFLSNVTHPKEQSLVWLWSPPWASGCRLRGLCACISSPPRPGGHPRGSQEMGERLEAAGRVAHPPSEFSHFSVCRHTLWHAKDVGTLCRRRPERCPAPLTSLPLTCSLLGPPLHLLPTNSLLTGSSTRAIIPFTTRDCGLQKCVCPPTEPAAACRSHVQKKTNQTNKKHKGNGCNVFHFCVFLL